MIGGVVLPSGNQIGEIGRERGQDTASEDETTPGRVPPLNIDMSSLFYTIINQYYMT